MPAMSYQTSQGQIHTVTALAENVECCQQKKGNSFLFTFVNTTKQVSVQMVSLAGQLSRSGVKGDRVSQQQVNRSLHILHHMMWLHQFWLENLISVSTERGLCDRAALIMLHWRAWVVDTCTHLETQNTEPSTCPFQPGNHSTLTLIQKCRVKSREHAVLVTDVRVYGSILLDPFKPTNMDRHSAAEDNRSSPVFTGFPMAWATTLLGVVRACCWAR